MGLLPTCRSCSKRLSFLNSFFDAAPFLPFTEFGIGHVLVDTVVIVFELETNKPDILS